jgi:dUTP pyrophosphatase
MLIDYFKLRENALDPVRANASDAGLDVFYCPADDRDSISVQEGESVVLETGIKFGIPHGFMLEVKNRSSVASKRRLIVGACVIDPGYNGELFINLINIGNTGQIIESGTKIAQVVMIPIIHFRARKVMTDTLYNSKICISNRGSSGFGSSGE